MVINRKSIVKFDWVTKKNHNHENLRKTKTPKYKYNNNNKKINK